MIILLGPDGTGKTTFAKKLEKEKGFTYYHYTKDSEYEDYLIPMCHLDWKNAVLDRHAICEFPYAKVMDREFKFSQKEWHNLILTTLIQEPLIFLFTHKPDRDKYDESQYLPYSDWDKCLDYYEDFLFSNKITFTYYDYSEPSLKLISIMDEHRALTSRIDWWEPMWKSGWGCIGSRHPKVLLVAERIGPNNTSNIPFETGPTGQMLTDLLVSIGVPLNKFTVTNMVKSFRRDARDVNDEDKRLLAVELERLQPKHVIFMGAAAKAGIPIARKAGIDYSEVPHFGAYAHKGDHTINRYVPHFLRVFDLIESKAL